MNEMNGDWNDLRLFISVAREGGLSPAAKATGRSAATLGRRMLALERMLNQDLFVRHSHGYELTSHGRQLLERVEIIEANIARVTVPSDRETRPLVKVSAGTWTTLALIQNLDQITGNPPDLRLRFISTESVLDISHREIVIGFRNHRPTENGLAGRKLVHVEFAPFATPDAPDKWIKVISDTPSARWLEKTVGNDGICEVSAPRNSLDLAVVGMGIALLPTFIGDAHSNLERRGGVISDLTHSQWIVTHQDDRHLADVRRAIDRMCAVLQNRL